MDWLMETGGIPEPTFTAYTRHNRTKIGRTISSRLDRICNSGRLGGKIEDMLWLRGKLLARLGEIAELRGEPQGRGHDDLIALWRYAEAEEIGRRLSRPDRFPLLTGASGRRWLRSLLRRAVAARSEDDIDTFVWVKIQAELVHRANLRRLSAYPSERTATLIDEALLERHIRGSAGAGNPEQSYKVLLNDRNGIVALGAPARIRLEHALERARSARIWGEYAGVGYNEARVEAAQLRQLIDTRYRCTGPRI